MDPALLQRITKLAEYTVRNGPAFEQQVQAKQGENPEYAFLNNGEGSAYYQWCLFCLPRSLPLDQQLPAGGQIPAAKQAGAAEATGAVPSEVSSGFAQVLELLQGTQVRHRTPPGSSLQARCFAIR